MFVQATKSRRGDKVYTSFLVRESFRTPAGPRSRTVCNISKLPPPLREFVADYLTGVQFAPVASLKLTQARDCGGLAVLVEAWQRFGLDQLFKGFGSPRQQGLLKAMIFSRLLFPCAKLALKDRAVGTLLAAACALDPNESFDEDDLYEAMDQFTGQWSALEKGFYAQIFAKPVRLVLYDLTSVYFEGNGPKDLAQYGHSRDHRGDRPQILLAVATDTNGVPLHLSVLRGNRPDTQTLQGLLSVMRRRFGINEAVFVFDGGMSSKMNLQALAELNLDFVTRLSNLTLEAAVADLPVERQLELGERSELMEIEHEGRRYVLAGGVWRQERDRQRRTVRIAKGEALLSKLAAVKRRKPDAQKLASQVGRELQRISAHKYFSYRVDDQGVLQWERKEAVIQTETQRDGWYLLHTSLSAQECPAKGVLEHYKNLLEVEEAFCELKSYLEVRPVFHYRPDRVVNHVRLCFVAYWISARLAREWKVCEEPGEVTRILRELQNIRLGQLQLGKNPATIQMFTDISEKTNALLVKLKLLHLFASPPKWAIANAL